MKNFFKTILFQTFSVLILIFSGCQGDNYYQPEDFGSVKKIDAHVHINTADPVLIEQAEADNVYLVTLNVASGRVPISEQRAVATELRNTYPERLAFATTFSLDNWADPEAWEKETINYLEDSFSQGAFGVKVWKNVGMELRNENGEFVMIDDSQFDPVFEYLSREGIPLFGHLGEPRNCWLPLDSMTVNNDRDYFENHPQYHMYLHSDYPSYEQIIESRNNMLDKNPDLVFFGAHLGSMEWSIDMMADHLNMYPNMVFGMAHRIPHLQYLAQKDRGKLRDFFIEYQDRLIYSTDIQQYIGSEPDEIRTLARNTWREDWEFFVTDDTLTVWQVDGAFQGLKLPKDVVDKIYWENAIKWMPGIGF